MTKRSKPKQQPTSDLATKAERLRAQTCALLGLDPARLSLADLVRVDRASTLRLRLSDLETLQLANASAFDVKEYTAVSEEYEKLLRTDVPVSPGMPGAGISRARARLRELLALPPANESTDEAEARHEAELAQRDQRIRDLEAKLLSAESLLYETRKHVEAVQAQHGGANVVQLPHYTRGPDEPWRAHVTVSRDGILNER